MQNYKNPMKTQKKSGIKLHNSIKSITFAPAFRRNRWQEVTCCLLCCVGTINKFNFIQEKWI